MADIANLNRVRKKKRAAEKEETAARNRVKFGRTKTEKAADKHERDRLKRELEGRRLDGE